MIPYNSDTSRSSASPDKRYRMSQPTLNSSFSGFNFVGGMKGSKLSYSSLRTSGDTTSNFQIKEERLSTPNVHCYIESGTFPRRLSGQHGSPSRLLLGPGDKRERLSQPTLITGDYYPGQVQHQRLSHPCLHTWIERPTSLHSPIKQKRFGSNVKISQRDRLSALDFGGSRFKSSKDTKPRDRFSIPELESQNELKLIAGTPKQRYSLDSQLNPDGTRARRLLPIASSPISEHQKDEKLIVPSEGLEGVIIASTTPLLPSTDRQMLAPIFQGKLVGPPPSISTRERMSVPEIRNSSLRRLLDPPARQRHSIADSIIPGLRHSLLSIDKSSEIPEAKPNETEVILETCEERVEKIEEIKLISADSQPNKPEESSVMPKHIQRHYSYTYDSKEETKEVIGKLSASKPRKKYLESNFDENEQVITTVIETEIPMILSSPKYMKKTHVYSTEAPKWMKKCLEEEKKVDDTLKINQKTKTSPGKKLSPGKTSPGKKKKSPDSNKSSVTKCDGLKQKETTIRIKSSGNLGENKYEIAVNSNISETDICRLYGIDCDSDSEDSTSV